MKIEISKISHIFLIFYVLWSCLAQSTKKIQKKIYIFLLEKQKFKVFYFMESWCDQLKNSKNSCIYF